MINKHELDAELRSQFNFEHTPIYEGGILSSEDPAIPFEDGLLMPGNSDTAAYVRFKASPYMASVCDLWVYFSFYAGASTDDIDFDIYYQVYPLGSPSSGVVGPVSASIIPDGTSNLQTTVSVINNNVTAWRVPAAITKHSFVRFEIVRRGSTDSNPNDLKIMDISYATIPTYDAIASFDDGLPQTIPSFPTGTNLLNNKGSLLTSDGIQDIELANPGSNYILVSDTSAPYGIKWALSNTLGGVATRVGPSETYTTLYAAVNAGARNILLTGDTSETQPVVFPAGVTKIVTEPKAAAPLVTLSSTGGLDVTTDDSILHLEGFSVSDSTAGNYSLSITGADCKVYLKAITITHSASSSRCISASGANVQLIAEDLSLSVPNFTTSVGIFTTSTAIVDISSLKITGGGSSCRAGILTSSGAKVSIKNLEILGSWDAAYVFSNSSPISIQGLRVNIATSTELRPRGYLSDVYCANSNPTISLQTGSTLTGSDLNGATLRLNGVTSLECNLVRNIGALTFAGSSNEITLLMCDIDGAVNVTTSTDRLRFLGCNFASTLTLSANCTDSFVAFCKLDDGDFTDNGVRTQYLLNTGSDVNKLTLEDLLFTLKGNLDDTKLARFNVDGITTSTTRTFTLPDEDGTLAVRNDRLKFNVTEQNTDFSAVINTVYKINLASNDVEVTLPSASLRNMDKIGCYITVSDATNRLTFTSSATINYYNSSALSIGSVDNEYVEFISDGTDWYVTNYYG